MQVDERSRVNWQLVFPCLQLLKPIWWNEHYIVCLDTICMDPALAWAKLLWHWLNRILLNFRKSSSTTSAWIEVHPVTILFSAIFSRYYSYCGTTIYKKHFPSSLWNGLAYSASKHYTYLIKAFYVMSFAHYVNFNSLLMRFIHLAICINTAENTHAKYE